MENVYSLDEEKEDVLGAIHLLCRILVMDDEQVMEDKLHEFVQYVTTVFCWQKALYDNNKE